MTQRDRKTAWTVIVAKSLWFKGVISSFIVFTIPWHKQNDHKTSSGTCCGTEPVTQWLLNQLLRFLDFRTWFQNQSWTKDSPPFGASNTPVVLVIKASVDHNLLTIWSLGKNFFSEHASHVLKQFLWHKEITFSYKFFAKFSNSRCKKLNYSCFSAPMKAPSQSL